MKITMIGDVAVLGVGPLRAGECHNLKPNNAKPHLDLGRAVEGHHDITPEAAKLLRAHYKDSGELLDPSEIDGTGKDGRILKSDVEALLGDEPEPDDEDEPEQVAAETFGDADEEE